MKNVITPYREALLKRVGKKLKFDYSLDDNGNITSLLKDFELIKNGGFINGFLSKKHYLDFEICIFDWYKNMTLPKITTCYFANSKALGLPEFFLRPETKFHKILEFFGFDDIDFSEAPKFSETYQLTGPNEEHIRAFMSKKVMIIFTRDKIYNLEAVNYYFLFYIEERCLNEVEIAKLYRQGKKLVHHFKSTSGMQEGLK